MDLLLNDFLHLSQEEINNSKIEFNMQAGGLYFSRTINNAFLN